MVEQPPRKRQVTGSNPVDGSQKETHTGFPKEEGYSHDCTKHHPPPEAPVSETPRRRGNKPKKKSLLKRWWFWLIVVLVVIGAVGAGQSGGNTTTPASTGGKTGQSTTAPAKPAEKTIELQTTASGEGTVMIWENGSSSSQKFSGNWSKTYTGDETKDLTMLSVSGDIMGGDDQTVSCKVIVNGQEKVSKDASGSIGSATCDIPLF